MLQPYYQISTAHAAALSRTGTGLAESRCGSTSEGYEHGNIATRSHPIPMQLPPETIRMALILPRGDGFEAGRTSEIEIGRGGVFRCV